jgi:hypothetical protein
MGPAETAATSVTENAICEKRIGLAGFLERKKAWKIEKDWSTDATLRTVCVKKREKEIRKGGIDGAPGLERTQNLRSVVGFIARHGSVMWYCFRNKSGWQCVGFPGYRGVVAVSSYCFPAPTTRESSFIIISAVDDCRISRRKRGYFLSDFFFFDN